MTIQDIQELDSRFSQQLRPLLARVEQLEKDNQYLLKSNAELWMRQNTEPQKADRCKHGIVVPDCFDCYPKAISCTCQQLGNYNLLNCPIHRPKDERIVEANETIIPQTRKNECEHRWTLSGIMNWLVCNKCRMVKHSSSCQPSPTKESKTLAEKLMMHGVGRQAAWSDLEQIAREHYKQKFEHATRNWVESEHQIKYQAAYEFLSDRLFGEGK